MKKKCITCFRVLSTPQRFSIFEFLQRAKDHVSVTKLVQLTRLRQPTVSFHIDQLERAGLVGRRRDGRTVYVDLHSRCKNCPLYEPHHHRTVLAV